MGRSRLLALAAVTAVVLAACGGDDGGADAPTSTGGGAIARVQTVAALEPVVRPLVDAYNQASSAGIELVVDAQAQVVEAVSQGQPAILPGAWLGGVDVDSTVIGRNLAVIAVPAGNPARVTGVDAFAAGSGLDTALCGADSPVGNFAALVVAKAAVSPDPARVASGCDADAVARVSRGELDAALVFRSLVPVPAGVELVAIPDGQNVVIDIRYAPAANSQGAGSFAGFLRSGTGKQILTQHGFLP